MLWGNCHVFQQHVLLILFIHFCVYVCVHIQVPWCMCGGQRTSCQSLFSPFHHAGLEDQTQVLRLEVKLLSPLGSRPPNNVLFMCSPTAAVLYHCSDALVTMHVPFNHKIMPFP